MNWKKKRVLVTLINKYLGKNVQPIYVAKPRHYLECTQADTTLMFKSLEIKPRVIESGFADYSQALPTVPLETDLKNEDMIKTSSE